MEGTVHGFLVMRTVTGTVIADGDLAQSARGDRVTSHLVFHFRGGSVQDETTVFSQRRSFRLLRDHLIQQGPAFKTPMDLSVDGVTGEVKVRYTDESGNSKED